jgi:hypothetical protein
MQKITLQGDKNKTLAGDILICRWIAEFFLKKTWKIDKNVGTVEIASS